MDDEAALFFFQELLDSDTSSEGSEDEVQVRGPLNIRPRIEEYVEEVVSNYYSDAEFRQHFRMYRATFNYVLEQVQDHISTNVLDACRPTITAKHQLLITLWYLGTPDSYRSICDGFNIGKATGLRTVRRVCNALVTISNNVIFWPSEAYLQEVIHGFNEMGFPNTIGCIDGMHIKIPKPKQDGISYINRKGFPSILLQAVCDHQLKFTHCYAGEVGSNHDATVLKRSEIWDYIRMPEKFPDDCHIIGDKAYPLRKQLMTPCKDNGHLTNSQKDFNFLLSRTRQTIERAFCLLQKRFRSLKQLLDVRCLEWSSKYIIACCVLHNICILQNDILDYKFIPAVQDNNDDIEVNNINNREQILLGRNKRDRLCNQLQN